VIVHRRIEVSAIPLPFVGALGVVVFVLVVFSVVAVLPVGIAPGLVLLISLIAVSLLVLVVVVFSILPLWLDSLLLALHVPGPLALLSQP